MRVKFFLLGISVIAMSAACTKKGPEPTPAKEFKITVSAGTGGTARATLAGAEVTKAEADKIISLSVSVDEGYEFTRWTTTTAGVVIANPTSPTTAFKMPARDVSITAEIGEKEKEYSITVTPGTGGGGTAKATVGGAEITKAFAGTVVTLTATENEGYGFVWWTTSTTGVEFAAPSNVITTFRMPPREVSIAAEFEELADDDEGVEVGGVIWATRNLYRAGSFAPAPESLGMLYQWGRKTAWSATDPLLASDGRTTWDDVRYDATVWTAANDPCPSGWRLPTAVELRKLLDGSKVTAAYSEPNYELKYEGMNFTDNATSKKLFLPAAGFRQHEGGAANFQYVYGKYWSSTPYNERSAHCLSFNNNWQGMTPGLSVNSSEFDYNSYGFSVRCVKSDGEIDPSTEYDITLTAGRGGEGGTATATVNGAAVTKAVEGTIVTLTATPTVPGYTFAGWTVTGGGVILLSDDYQVEGMFGNPARFIVLREDVSITVAFETPPAPEGAVINGVHWAGKNVDAPDTFAATPESYGMFYQWGRKVGWRTDLEPYENVPFYGTDGSLAADVWNTPYTGTVWLPANDPCPAGWRVPTIEEFRTLIDGEKVTSQWIEDTETTVGGRRFTDKSAPENSIFLPFPGYRSNNYVNAPDTPGIVSANFIRGRGYNSNYWTSTAYSSGTHAAYMSSSNSDASVYVNHWYTSGCSVRCVAE